MGGHVGPNLGIVELTVALHRVFRSSTDRLVFDVSHQTYAHKMLTGRTWNYLDPARMDSGLVIVVNDNEWSISENQGGLYVALARLHETAVITGGTSDIGLATTEAFLKHSRG